MNQAELIALPKRPAFPAGELTERIIAEKQGSIGWLTFNNPARRNAISIDMWEAIPKVLDRFEQDPDVRVIVLKGDGDKAFVSGADVSQYVAGNFFTAVPEPSGAVCILAVGLVMIIKRRRWTTLG